MRKKSFWLSSNSRIPVPPERSRGLPGRSPCTRRPVSSEAPGRGGVPAQRGRTRKSAERQPRRSSPFPPVSSSSSSFCLLRFPAVFRSLLRLRGSVPEAASPNRLRGSSIEFKSVKNVSVCLNPVQAPLARLPSFRPASFPSVSALLRPASAEFSSSSDGRPSAVRGPRLTTRSRPPVPLVCCSFRSWFVSRFGLFVRFCSTLFVSVQLRPAPSCSASSCPFPSVLPFVASVLYPVRFLSLFLVFCPLTGDLFIYFSRILYTIYSEIQMYFLSKNMSFLEIIALCLKNPKRRRSYGKTFPHGSKTP